MKNRLSRWKKTARNKITNIKTNVQDGVQQFQENFSAAKNKPRSKRKSFLLGAVTVFGVFGVTLFARVLPTIAKDVSNNIPMRIPNEIPWYMPWLEPAPMSPDPDNGIVKKIQKALSDVVESICGGAVARGFYVLGTVSGVIVVIVLFYAPKK